MKLLEPSSLTVPAKLTLRNAMWSDLVNVMPGYRDLVALGGLDEHEVGEGSPRDLLGLVGASVQHDAVVRDAQT